jgi:hypothetical protein
MKIGIFRIFSLLSIMIYIIRAITMYKKMQRKKRHSNGLGSGKNTGFLQNQIKPARAKTQKRISSTLTAAYRR